jgi:Uma2 family endonuclease
MQRVARGATLKPMQSSDIRDERPIVPIAFPATDPEWEMSENKRHQLLCEVLRALLRAAVGVSPAAIGSDQFVYFDPADPQRKCAPDGFVKLGVIDWQFPVWKTWEHGTPELCIEILSPSDAEKLTLAEKLERFRAMGVREVVCFDIDAAPGARIRAWDLQGGDLVERVVEGDRTPWKALGLWFVVAPAKLHELPAALRLAADSEGATLVATPLEAAREAIAAARDAVAAERQAKEAERQAKEAERQAKEAERQAKEAERQAKEAALNEVARLRAELARRDG